MKVKKATKEFVVGKHKIGWISSNFIEKTAKSTMKPRGRLATFQTLEKAMTDAEIERDITLGTFATLGDVSQLLDSKNPVFQDGYANLFYFPECVVSVIWYADDREWYVYTWDRVDAYRWYAGYRVFSPATDRSAPVPSSPSGSLPLDLVINGLTYRRV